MDKLKIYKNKIKNMENFEFEKINNHMAVLRNLRNIAEAGVSNRHIMKVCDGLKKGVLTGKQFPFRYWSAYKSIENSGINHEGILLDALEECMDISVANTPKLEGKTMCLSDNSGSAWGALTSEYGKTTIAEIANLSSLISGKQSDEGEIGLFGNKLIIKNVSKRNGLLKQLKEANDTERKDHKLGGGTENGIWIFFNNAIKQKLHYDNIFIYSDQQAGTGGLYGINEREYKNFIFSESSRHIDVLALVTEYRKVVNPKVNVFSVQVAGYDNSVLPANLYRGAILSGWTGKETIFAKSIIDTWNEIEK